MKDKVTRGYGYLEGWLARRRCRQANILIQQELRAGRVLDIGSGSHPFFLLHTEFFEKYGVDQLVSALDKEKFAKKKICLSHFDINKHDLLPFADDYFDAVMMLAVIEHLWEKELRALLREIFRVLKRGGSFIYTTPSPGTDFLLKLLSKIKLVSETEIREHKYYYAHEKIKSLLSASGFNDKHMEFGYFECGMNTWGRVKK